MLYQEYYTGQNDLAAFTNPMVLALSQLTGCRMANVHAALWEVNPRVEKTESGLILPIDEHIGGVMGKLTAALERLGENDK